MSRHPTTKWAQTSDKVFITIELPDAKDVKLALQPDGHFNFSATGGPVNIPYEINFELYDKVNVEESKTAIGLRNICYLVKKAEKKWWSRLLKQEGKPPVYLKVDWDRWVDEDDEDENKFGDKDFGDMDFSKLGMDGEDEDFDFDENDGGYCAFVDAEHALDPAMAESIGVKTENLLLSQPDSGEQALSLVDTLIRSGSVDVVVVDSVAALVPKSELDGEMGDAHMALQARLMSQALRKLSHSLSLSQTILVFINQVRSKLQTFGGFGGPVEVTSGGNALKFYASVRLNIKRIGLVKKGEETVGSQVLVKIVKNKHAPPFRTAQFELEFGKGISLDAEIIELSCKHKFITKTSGAFYNLNGKSFHGKEAIKRFFAENEEAREELITKLREKLLHSETVKKHDGESEVADEGQAEEEIVTSEATDEEAANAAEA